MRSQTCRFSPPTGGRSPSFHSSCSRFHPPRSAATEYVVSRNSIRSSRGATAVRITSYGSANSESTASHRAASGLTRASEKPGGPGYAYEEKIGWGYTSLPAQKTGAADLIGIGFPCDPIGEVRDTSGMLRRFIVGSTAYLLDWPGA
jgi:hypothetical protein